MTIGPEDIERAVFKERFRGYDPDQVDRFLDQVASSLAALRAERDELAAERETLRGGGMAPVPSLGPGGGEHMDALIKRTLHAAQRSAEELLADARRQAGELLEDARGRAEREREQARAEAELVRRAAAELRAFRDDYRGRLHAIMSEQLAALDRAGELPRLPAAVEQLGEASVVMRREPSPAQTWAAAAANEPEEPAPADDVDGLDSPWDELWHGARGEAETSVAPRVDDVPILPAPAGPHESAPFDAGDA